MRREHPEFNMRWILLCLVFFNLLYFGWQFFLVPRGAVEPSVSVVTPTVDAPRGERLVLLKEVLTRSSQAAPPPSINRAIRQQEMPVTVQEPVPAAVPPGSASAPRRPVGGEAAPVPADIASDDEESRRLSDSPEPDEPDSGTAVRDRICAKVGPYEEESLAEALVAGLEAEDVESVIRSDDVVYDVENWVLIPPLGSRAEALRMLRRLQSNKIDSYLITEGEFANGISLGLFKQSASAQGVLARMVSAGYEAEIHQLERKKARFWVGLSGEFEPGRIDQMLTQLVDDSEKIKFSESLCEMFASTP